MAEFKIALATRAMLQATRLPHNRLHRFSLATASSTTREELTATSSKDAIADTAERQRKKYGEDGHRLDLRLFVYDDGSVRLYTSQVGISGEDVRAVEPVVGCSNRFEATGALAEILRMINVDRGSDCRSAGCVASSACALRLCRARGDALEHAAAEAGACGLCEATGRLVLP